MKTPSKLDNDIQVWARKHITDFLQRYITGIGVLPVLEIGPDFSKDYLVRGSNWDTLDIKPGCTYQADITKTMPIALCKYDMVVCMEVLEHVTFPDIALANIQSVVKEGGLLLASAPWNFRCHGPLPDLWRFNQNTWKLLLRNWDIIEMDVMETPDRPLMPAHICVAARCNKSKRVDPSTMKWELL